MFRDVLHTNEKFNIFEISTMYKDLFTQSLEVDFSNWGSVMEEINNLDVKFDGVACWDEGMIHIADDISKGIGLTSISSLNFQPFRSLKTTTM